jgi:hypothetical protein
MKANKSTSNLSNSCDIKGGKKALSRTSKFKNTTCNMTNESNVTSNKK